LYERFIARQPILDSRLHLYGYELLFRESDSSHTVKLPAATSHVIASSTMVFNWTDLVGSNRAFLNFSASELINGAALLLSRKQVVIEIPKSTPIDEAVLAACRNLHDTGYTIAVDDFAELPEQQPLVDICTYLKVDFRNTTPDAQARIGETYEQGHSNGPKLVAKKVETWQEYDRARKLGFSLFQGFFFLQPQVLHHGDIPSSHVNALQLLNAVHRSPLDILAVDDILKHDLGLTYKLLRFLNSPIMARRAEIRSVPNAIALLGEQAFRRWATLAAVVSPASEKPSELVQMALIRASLCEKMAQRMGHGRNAYEFFLVGLLSFAPALLDQPLSHIAAELPLSDELNAALNGKPNALRHALDAVLAYEQARWKEFVAFMECLALPEDAMPECFTAAHVTARELAGAP
jgi:c-di-GMP-related signal transduction protein